MQVFNSADKASSTLVAKKEATAFTTNSSAEFFEILSTALYKNPLLAFVRETLANAWDAHIDAGRINTPVEINLDNDYLTIRDFGKGIPHDKMTEVYCVYGKSTKKNDGAQTGGFGLGCKSPFAYTNTFEVTSLNQGQGGTYVLVKNDPNMEGLPSCTPVATFPSVGSGLSVKIPITDQLQTIRGYIKEVVRVGGIFATLNGSDLPRVEMGTETNDYLFSDGTNLASGNIYVRYGSVVYPVPKHEEYAIAYEEITSFLYSYNLYTLTIQAAPHSLAITPSREELSMQQLTTDTLFTLMDTFIRNTLSMVQATVESTINTGWDAYLKDNSWVQLAEDFRNRFSIGDLLSDYLPKPIHNTGNPILDKAILNVIKHYNGVLLLPNSAQFVRHLRNRMYKAMWSKITRRDIPKLRTVIRILRSGSTSGIISTDSVLKVHSKMLQAVRTNPLVKPNNLSLISYGGTAKRPPYERVFSTKSTYIGVLYANHVVVLTSTRADTLTKVKRALCDEPSGQVFQYTLPKRTDTCKRETTAFFKSYGFKVIDCTVPLERVPSVPVSKGEKVVRITKYPVIHKNGSFLTLSNAPLTSTGRPVLQAYTKVREDYEPVYSDKPVAYLRISMTANSPINSSDLFPDVSWRDRSLFTEASVLKYLRNTFGDKIALIHTNTQQEKLVQQGVPTIGKFFLKHWQDDLQGKKYNAIWDYVLVKHYFDRNAPYMVKVSHLSELLELAPKTIKYKYPTAPSSDADKLMVTLFEEVCVHIRSSYGTTMQMRDIDSISTPYKKLIDKCNNISDMVERFECNPLIQELKKEKPDEAKVKYLTKLLRLILN